ncbi:hypothetical protein BGZ82_001606 [Podila clonocystis]|nr:hypothetical protein BGZ82_001606 [Podila clonocystis]
MNPLANSLGNSLAHPPLSARSAQNTPRTSLDMLRNPSTSNNSSPSSSHSTHSAHSTGTNTSPSTSFSLSIVNPPSPPTSKPFHRNPSIRVQNEKKEKDKDKDKNKDKDKDRKRGDDAKIALKRSRSPIKLFKNIKSYMHVHKHKGTNGSVIQGSPGSTGYYFNNSLALPNSGDSSHNYRNTALPSSSILSPGPSSGQPSLSRPRERQPSESLDPEKQVLLLRVMSYFEHAGHRADEETAEYLLSSYQWDINLTLQYCQDLVEAVHGTLLPIHQEDHLSGAVNDQMTSCYIDALLFAMFARLTAFEGLLNVNLDGDSDSDSDGSGKVAEPKAITAKQEMLLSTHRLQTWLRMFVNQLRSGKLIQAHVVKELRQHLYCCGWHCPGPMDPPGSSRQEDASELFMFLTEKLHLPYLPLEQRLLHGARISDDDDKVITERMLQISIPSPEVPQLSLMPDAAKPPKESTFSKFLGQKSTSHSRSESTNGAKSADGSTSTLHDVLSLETLLAQHFYDNTLTGIRRKVSAGTGVPLSPGVEVPVSAWQVLELLPFYSSSNEQGGEIYANQSQYPSDVVILPLILKRYSIGPDMRPRRIGTPIDIPRRIDFSRFVNPQTPGAGKKATKAASDATGVGGPPPPPPPSTLDPNHTAHPNAPSSLEDPAGARNRSSSSASRLSHSNVATLGASSSMHGISGSSSTPPPMKINTQVTPSRKYSMSLLQAATTGSGMPESPMIAPGTPPPVYTPSHAKQFLEFTDDKKSWAHPPDRTGRDYMDCHPKVKYMLELKSVVCHLGTQLNSGHYRSYVADAVGKPSDSSSSPPQEPNWLRHDDLDPSGHRVQLIQRDSVENMDMESDWARNGYILFYELQTIQLV